jgi:hypothetical protein
MTATKPRTKKQDVLFKVLSAAHANVARYLKHAFEEPTGRGFKSYATFVRLPGDKKVYVARVTVPANFDVSRGCSGANLVVTVGEASYAERQLLKKDPTIEQRYRPFPIRRKAKK